MCRSKLRVGDEVQVIAGKEKGRRGRLIAIDLKNERVYVEGLNRVLKNVKPVRQGQEGSQRWQEGGIPLCKVMVWDAQAGKPTRVRMQKEGEEWVRVSQKTGNRLPIFGKAESRALKANRQQKTAEATGS